MPVRRISTSRVDRTDNYSEMIRAGHGVALLTIALLMVGVLMVNSTGLVLGADVPPVTRQSVFLGEPAQHAFLAILALLLGAWFPVSRLGIARSSLRTPALWLCVLGMLFLILAWVPSVGRSLNASNRWIELAGVRFQASELIKWTLPLFLAWWVTRPSVDLQRFWKGLLPLLILVGIVGATIAVEDLGTAFLVTVVALALLIAAGGRLLHFILLAPIGLLGLIAGILAEPYRVQRLVTFLDPFADPEHSGWHIIQSLRAIAGGGVLGRGLGAGEQKFDLVSDTTDFIFSIICEELGLVGAGLVITAFAALLWCGFSIVSRPTTVVPPPSGGDASSGAAAASTGLTEQADSFMRLFGLGILLTLGFQALFNLLVTTAMVPTKGIALPLISRGGTGWILTALFLGLLISIDRALAASAVPRHSLDSDGPEQAPAGALSS